MPAPKPHSEIKKYEGGAFIAAVLARHVNKMGLYGVEASIEKHPTKENVHVLNVKVSGIGKGYVKRAHEHIRKSLLATKLYREESEVVDEADKLPITRRISNAIKGTPSAVKSFARNLKHYSTNPDEAVPDHPSKYKHQPKKFESYDDEIAELEQLLEAKGHQEVLNAAAAKAAKKARARNYSPNRARGLMVSYISKAHNDFVRGPGRGIRTIAGALTVVAPPVGIAMLGPMLHSAKRVDDSREQEYQTHFTKKVQNAYKHGMHHYLRGM